MKQENEKEKQNLNIGKKGKIRGEKQWKVRKKEIKNKMKEYKRKILKIWNKTISNKRKELRKFKSRRKRHKK